MLMKNFTLKKGKSGKPGDPVSYILSDRDHTGKLRSVKPEIIGGDEFALRTSIENNSRELKYTSGVLSFANHENPTQEQIDQVLEKFTNTFLPGNAVEHVPHLFVAHRDKGNLEIHYVVAREWIKNNGTTASFNMAPPGKKHIQFKDDFVSTTNHELGYEQINSDPFSIALEQFDRLDKTESKFRKQFKGKIKSGLKELVMNGSINNRDDLIQFLQEHGSITRANHNFISFKTESQDKPIRLKGGLFADDADYNEIRKEYKAYVKAKSKGITLTPEEYDEKKERLEIGVAERLEFNRGRYEKPKQSRTRQDRYVTDANGKRKLKVNPNAYKPKRKRGTPIKKDTGTGTGDPNKMAPKPLPKPDSSPEMSKNLEDVSPKADIENKKLADVSAKKIDTSSGSAPITSGSSSNPNIGALSESLENIRHQIQHEKNPAKLSALRAKASELEGKLAVAITQERIRKMKESEKLSTHKKLKL